MKARMLAVPILLALLAACGEPTADEPRESRDGCLVAKLLDVCWEGLAAGQAIEAYGRVMSAPKDFAWIEARLEIVNVSSKPCRVPGTFVVGRREGQKAGSMLVFEAGETEESLDEDHEIPAGGTLVLILRSIMQEPARYSFFRPLEIRHDEPDWRWPVEDPPPDEVLYANAIREGCLASLAGEIVTQEWTRMPAGTTVETDDGPRQVSEGLLFLDLEISVRNRAEGPVDFLPPFEVHRDGDALSPLRPDQNHHTHAQWNEVANGIGPGETRRFHVSTTGMSREKAQSGHGLHAVHLLCGWKLEVKPPPVWEEIPVVGKKPD